MKTTTRVPRMQGIDGLRAIAVGAVFVYHADNAWLPGGFLGVDVFFVISGFLITSLLLAEFSATGRVALGAFWVRRARRLLPAVFALLAVCLLVAATVARHRLDVRADAVAATFYVSNWRFIFEHQSYFDLFGRPPLLRHLWSLAVEEQFYLLWPVLLLLGLRFVPRLLPILVAVAAIGSTALMWVLYEPANPSRAYYGTDTRAAPLLVGALLAFIWRPGMLPAVPRRFGRPLLDALAIAALLAVGWSFARMDGESEALYHGGFLVLALVSALLLASVVHPSSAVGGMLDRPTLRWLGERSYAIYLWHWPVIALTRPGIDVQISRVPLLVAQIAITLVLADLSYRLVERPIRNGALGRVRVRVPSLGARFRVAVAAPVACVGALLVLAALTPERGSTLPPGFTSSALLASKRSEMRLARLPQAKSRMPTTTSSTTVRAAEVRDLVPRRGPILAIGDSVMLGASSALRTALGRNLRIDAVVARQADETIDRLLEYRARGELPDRVVVHVGDNGPVYWAQWQRLKAALAGVPLVVLVNVRVDRSWQGQVNRSLGNTAARWRTATVADWFRASSRPGTIVDGIHTSSSGARLYATVIRNALRSPGFAG